LKEGLANSTANGLISLHLELSADEREKVRAAAEVAKSEYAAAVRKAQVVAIRQLKKSLPLNKQAGFEEFIGPFLFSHKTFWKMPSSNLDAQESLPTTVYRHKGKN
jgi:hypothetical protein